MQEFLRKTDGNSTWKNLLSSLTIWKTRIRPKGVAKKLTSKPIESLRFILTGTSFAIIKSLFSLFRGYSFTEVPQDGFHDISDPRNPLKIQKIFFFQLVMIKFTG